MKNQEEMIYSIIKRPIINEASMIAQENRVYTFEVDKKANKNQIKVAVEKLFDVQVEKVNVLNTKPRPRRVGQYSGYKKSYKKAMVKLKADSKAIAGFDLE